MSQSSSAKLGEEACGQGLANLAMALAKLRYEDTAFMEALAGIVCGSIERLSLVDVGQIAFAFGKLRIESSEAVPAMFGCIAERVADEEESLSRHLPTACSLLYGMHRLGLECSEFSEMVASRLHPAVGNLDVKQLLLIIPACRYVE
ncbi:hypothetical protein Pmar_PMAR014714 [Perkinsus marinus ATCC 50983]|uniref:Uncharacterized protein n=1 Tax=Perkinsus marinus (strain ATCC 50983 / TXsc) TaxID=423536 RepID=C5LIU2_PERM5|nr:hypothetical protein Pmar_PMAR014714 [Perkinsus marinus ATCC 50983]EER03495.1 hypothetical protein Pmar_PMAR014714 [Perkinsus marinus ATCC 50983]|eukprot:XP_002771679.1 hypothetical protein Pmar_PMAR014714 [Perkinsus marinus ATCC 50983]